MGDINLKLKNSVGTVITVTLYNVRYVPSFIGNLFSIPTAMADGAEIRFVNNKMEVQKNNDVFEFLPSNNSSYSSLFSIRAKRKNVDNGWAYMARKTEHVNDNDNQDRHKKVKFDENATVYLYDKENENEQKPADKKSKKEKIRNINEYHKVLGLSLIHI